MIIQDSLLLFIVKLMGKRTKSNNKGFTLRRSERLKAKNNEVNHHNTNKKRNISNILDNEEIILRRIKRLKKKENNKVNHHNTNKREVIPNILENEDNKNIWDKLNSYQQFKGIKPEDEWVSGTAIRNFMLSDPIIDWLDKYYTRLGFNDGTVITPEMKYKMEGIATQERNKMAVLFTNGLLFENAVFEELKRKYPYDYVQIGYERDDITNGNHQKTINNMKQGVPIIIQAVLINERNKTRGMADLLVRSDYINRLFGSAQLADEEINISGSKLGTNFHYRVIDIKWTTLNLCAGGKLIRNDERVPAYKGQLAIYNCILGYTQGYYPKQAYILGHSWKYETCGNKFNGNSCFDLLGHIDYSNFDKPYLNKTINAIRWVRNLRCNGYKWKLIPPSVPELYPNMSNTNDIPWSEVKDIISNRIHELTKLWKVGPRNRRVGHSNNIYRWSDKNCRSSKLGINGEKIGPILDRIIQINQSKKYVIKPNIIKNNELNWQLKSELDFFVDFETVNGCFIKTPTNIYNNKSDTNIIFLIGVGYCDNNIWKYKSFKIDKLNIEDEAPIIDEWIDFINSEIGKYSLRNKIKKKGKIIIPRFFHWGSAEVTSINIANRRHNFKWLNWLNNILWIDLCKIFQTEPIVIKGAFSFKLKEIGKCMYEHGLINTIWDTSGISDGLSAMVNAIEHYKLCEISPTGVRDKPNIMQQIEKYNEIDCKVMLEIVEYLRGNHT